MGCHFLILKNTLQNLLAPIDCAGSCGANLNRNNIIVEDEIMSKEDADSFDSIINEISQKKKMEEGATEQHTCPFAGGLGGIDLLSGLEGLNSLGALGAMGMLGGLGGGTGPSLDVAETIAAFDPSFLVNLLKTLMDTIENTVEQELEKIEVGACPQIQAVDIFLLKKPYERFDVLLTKDEGIDSLAKLGEIRAELESKTMLL